MKLGKKWLGVLAGIAGAAAYCWQRAVGEPLYEEAVRRPNVP